MGRIGWIAAAEGELDLIDLRQETEVDRQPKAGQKRRDGVCDVFESLLSSEPDSTMCGAGRTCWRAGC